MSKAKRSKQKRKNTFGKDLAINFSLGLAAGLLFFLLLKGAQYLVESQIHVLNQWTFLFLQMPAWFFAILIGLFVFLWRSFKERFVRFALSTCGALFILMLSFFLGESWMDSANIIRDQAVSDSFNTTAASEQKSDSDSKESDNSREKDSSQSESSSKSSTEQKEAKENESIETESSKKSTSSKQTTDSDKESASDKKTTSTIILPTPGLSEAKEETDPELIMKEPVPVYYVSAKEELDTSQEAELEALQQFIEELPDVLLEETKGIYLVEDDLYDGAFSKEIGLAGTGGFSTSAEMEVFIKILTDEIPNYYNQLVNGSLVPYGSIELYKNNLYHELGHIMDYSEANNPENAARHLYSDSEELMAFYQDNPELISEYGATTPHEFFAEATALYYTDPDLLKTKSQDLFDYLDDIYQQY